jgi:hypothetical protein
LDDVEIDKLASDVHLEIVEFVIITDFNLFKQRKFDGFGKNSNNSFVEIPAQNSMFYTTYFRPRIENVGFHFRGLISGRLAFTGSLSIGKFRKFFR